MPRFIVGVEMAAKVQSHASIAANLIDRLMESQEHYDGLLRELAARDRQPASVDASEHRAQWLQLRDQLSSTRDELRVLAADAKQQGSANLRNRRLSVDTKIDKSLRELPERGDVMGTAAFLHVIQASIARNCRDVAEQIERLLIPMSKVPDPGVLAFASTLQRLATGLRPPGIDRGPYAPRYL